MTSSSSSSITLPLRASRCQVCSAILRATVVCTHCGRETCSPCMQKSVPPATCCRCVNCPPAPEFIPIKPTAKAKAGEAGPDAAQAGGQRQVGTDFIAHNPRLSLTTAQSQTSRAVLEPRPKAWTAPPDAPTLLPRQGGDPSIPEVAMEEFPMPKHIPLSARDVADSYLEPDQLPISCPTGPAGYLQPDVKIREVVRVAAAPLPVRFNYSDLMAVEHTLLALEPKEFLRFTYKQLSRELIEAMGLATLYHGTTLPQGASIAYAGSFSGSPLGPGYKEALRKNGIGWSNPRSWPQQPGRPGKDGQVAPRVVYLTSRDKVGMTGIVADFYQEAAADDGYQQMPFETMFGSFSARVHVAVRKSDAMCVENKASRAVNDQHLYLPQHTGPILALDMTRQSITPQGRTWLHDQTTSRHLKKAHYGKLRRAAGIHGLTSPFKTAAEPVQRSPQRQAHVPAEGKTGKQARRAAWHKRKREARREDQRASASAHDMRLHSFDEHSSGDSVEEVSDQEVENRQLPSYRPTVR